MLGRWLNLILLAAASVALLACGAGSGERERVDFASLSFDLPDGWVWQAVSPKQAVLASTKADLDRSIPEGPRVIIRVAQDARAYAAALLETAGLRREVHSVEDPVEASDFGIPAIKVDISGREGNMLVRQRHYFILPGPVQPYQILLEAPEAQWSSGQRHFQRVLETLRFQP